MIMEYAAQWWCGLCIDDAGKIDTEDDVGVYCPFNVSWHLTNTNPSVVLFRLI